MLLLLLLYLLTTVESRSVRSQIIFYDLKTDHSILKGNSFTSYHANDISFCQIIFRKRKKLPGIFATELIIINFLYCLELIRQLVGCFPAKKERRGTLGPLHVEEEMRHLLA